MHPGEARWRQHTAHGGGPTALLEHHPCGLSPIRLLHPSSAVCPTALGHVCIFAAVAAVACLPVWPCVNHGRPWCNAVQQMHLLKVPLCMLVTHPFTPLPAGSAQQQLVQVARQARVPSSPTPLGRALAQEVQAPQGVLLPRSSSEPSWQSSRTRARAQQPCPAAWPPSGPSQPGTHPGSATGSSADTWGEARRPTADTGPCRALGLFVMTDSPCRRAAVRVYTAQLVAGCPLDNARPACSCAWSIEWPGPHCFAV